MFYADVPTQLIRQGDIFEGVVSVGIIPSKFLTATALNKESDCFSVNLGFSYASVITPCCDIHKRDYLAFCPLTPLDVRIRRNEYFDEDPTRLNIKVKPENMVPKNSWDGFSEEEKAQRTAQGKQYAFVHNFVFEKQGDIFSDHMVIDFNYIFNVKRTKLGAKNEVLLPHRTLQLSDESRRTLRLKLANYYFRDPDACSMSQ
jgi:hypothetical protein